MLSTTRSHYFFCKSQHSLLHLLKLGYNIPSDKLFFSHTAKVYFSLSYHFPPNITKYYKLLLFERYSLKKGKPDWICFCKYLCDKGLLSTLQKLQVIIFLVFSGFLSFLLFSFVLFSFLFLFSHYRFLVRSTSESFSASSPRCVWALAVPGLHNGGMTESKGG